MIKIIKGKVIYFGYGDIAVGANRLGYLLLRQFKPPAKIGNNITSENSDVEWLSDTVAIKVQIEDCKKFNAIDLLKNKQIDLDGVTLDFNNYNKKSVEVVKKYVDKAMYYERICLAC